MFKDNDFRFDNGYFYVKKDKYPLSKIKNARIQKLTLANNIGHIIFWLTIFAGPIWLAVQVVGDVPNFILILAIILTILGFIVAIFRCAKFALQVQFAHIDETGLKWINVAKSYSSKNNTVFEAQVKKLKV